MIETTPEVISPTISLLYPKAENKIQPKGKQGASVFELGSGAGPSCCALRRNLLWLSVLQSQLCFFSSVSCFTGICLYWDLYFISLKQKLRPLYHSFHNYDFPSAQTVKCLSTTQETRV